MLGLIFERGSNLKKKKCLVTWKVKGCERENGQAKENRRFGTKKRSDDDVEKGRCGGKEKGARKRSNFMR